MKMPRVISPWQMTGWSNVPGCYSGSYPNTRLHDLTDVLEAPPDLRSQELPP